MVGDTAYKGMAKAMRQIGNGAHARAAVYAALWPLPALLLLCFVSGALYAQPGPGGPSRGGNNARPGPRPGGQHLPQWFAQHQNLNPSQQENALRSEPGFGHLPEGQHQQLINRLHRLDTAPPAQRQRMLERNERFEALRPERQQEIRGASQALGQMPPDRRQAVRDAFRDLRALPPDQRESALGSARFQAEYTPQERTILGNLLSIEPYHPPQ